MRQAAVSCSAVALTLQLLGGCAQQPGATAPGRDPTVITRSELQQGQFQTAFEAVQRLRPRWLRNRDIDDTFSASSTIQVYQDDVRLGGPATLHDIPATIVLSIRYFDGTRAAARWGRGHDSGVLLVVTRPDGAVIPPDASARESPPRGAAR